MTNRRRNLIALFALLFFFWVLLNGTLAIDVLVVGVLAALVISLLFRDNLTLFSEFRATPRAFGAMVRYLVYFFRELLASNIKIAGIVISPSMPIEPAIVKVRTHLKSRMGRLLLANSITLTPGTLSVELKDEWLYVHWVATESTDIDAATARIVRDFERHLRIMYG
uniref:Multicomponent Na+:H+ antiporter subunit E n=1 Tax=Candidatus Kentrum sp. FM TaxID=2126340 RepID=A0A450VYE9_9GAMM|nr:MAG: multicomponent Na+:H+ antiporter subunit E [Candidatus Kentron sp. FM]VFJ55409.1 MAG: multicomponent Na+:H+ antiporter subunit E [Candidatus Kentron sp. FM]VFK09833.1 MAG: multicomponent Na+:H+ antiporter subunit E [Candidatus Kentron sp. FM]